jgi:tetratricopeptide (TPR) repeat protein
MHRRLDSWSFFALIAAAVLPLVWAIPSEFLPFQLSKTVLFAFFALVSFICFLAARVKEQEISFPRYLPLFVAPLVPAAYLASTLLSSDIAASSLGERFSTDTFAFVALGTIAFYVTALIVRTKSQILFVLTAILAAFFVIGIVHIGAFFSGGGSSLGGMLEPNDTLLGRLQDTAFLYGLIAILSLVTITGLRIGGWMRVMLHLALGLSLFLLAVINLAALWWMLGAVAFSTLAFNFFKRNSSRGQVGALATPHPEVEGSSISAASLVVLGVAFIFIVSGTTITTALGSLFNAGQVNVRPSWTATASVGELVYRDSALFGSGPTTFEKQWALHRPADLNATLFWNTDFASGVGFLPTSFITTGILGMVAWIVFLGSIAILGYAALVQRPREEILSYYLTLAAFLGTAYLWAIAINYSPSSVILTLAFVFSGLLISAVRVGGPKLAGEYRLQFSERPRQGFLAVLTAAVLILASAGSMLKIGELYVADLYLRKAATLVSTDPARAETLAIQSSRVRESDEAARVAASAALADLVALSRSSDAAEQDGVARIEERVTAAVNYAEIATQLDPADYKNWFALAQVYHRFVPLGVEGAYDRAAEKYAEALLRRPQSPVIKFAQAQLERDAGNVAQAKTYITEALAGRPQYTEALFLLAQINIQEGAIQDAIKSIETAIVYAPNNPAMYFQLGLLRYSATEYTEAEAAFTRAITLRDDYANARYFRGLTYYFLDRTAEAVAEFERVHELNPENEEVSSILANLREGKEPFATLASSPQVSDLSGPPLEEETELTEE